MRVAVDLDVLLAALAADGTVRRLLVLSGLELVCPEGTFDVLAGHGGLLAARTRTDRKDVERALELVSGYVEEVPFDRYEDRYEGLELAYPWAGVREVDLLALAKAEGCPVWTTNEAFAQADDLEVWSTQDVTREAAR